MESRDCLAERAISLVSRELSLPGFALLLRPYCRTTASGYGSSSELSLASPEVQGLTGSKDF